MPILSVFMYLQYFDKLIPDQSNFNWLGIDSAFYPPPPPPTQGEAISIGLLTSDKIASHQLVSQKFFC